MKKYMAVIGRLPFHPNRNTRTLITLIYTVVALFANFFMFQVFCVPVEWAAWYCSVFIFGILIHPFVGSSIAKLLSGIVLGAGILPCIYCIIFLTAPAGLIKGYIGYTLLILLCGSGLLAYLPVYLLWQIVMNLDMPF